MYRKRRSVERQAALFLLGVLMLVPPLLIVFDKPVRAGGIPVLYLYLFVAWTALIGMTAAISRKFEDDDGANRGSDGLSGGAAAGAAAEPATDA